MTPISADTRLTRTRPVIDITHSANKCNVFGGSIKKKSLARTLTCDRYNSLKWPCFRLVTTEQYFTSSRVMNHVIAASGQPIHWLSSFYDLFFLWFPLCTGETGLLVTPKCGYFRNLFPVVPSCCCSFLSIVLPPLPLSDCYSHNPPILAVVFLVLGNLLASSSRITS